MKFALLLTALSLSGSGLAAVSGTLQLDFWRDRSSSQRNPTLDRLREKKLLKRAVNNTVSQDLDNEYYLYYTNVTVGTPGQDLRLQIDTGSSDVWFQSAENKICQESSDPCAESGIYDPDSSSTYSLLSTDFSIRYGDYSYAKGNYASESFTIGGKTVANLTVGIATDANATQGIMGIGYDTNEAVIFTAGASRRYQNLPDLLVSQGFIESRVYSLWLNDQNAKTGSVLFGGIDTEKYSGSLVTLPFIADEGESTPSEFFVTLEGSAYTDASGSTTEYSSSLGLSVLLDSGTSFVYLPSSVQADFANAVGATWNDQVGYYIIPCPEVVNSDATYDFEFAGITIKVPVKQLFLPGTNAKNEPVTYTNGQQVCLLTIVDSSGLGVSILGDTFLRAAYIVYDLDNNQASIAQTKYNATASNVVAVGSGTDSVANAAASAGSAAVLSDSDVAKKLHFGYSIDKRRPRRSISVA
ncbi:aspartic peptidase domain-containing protein [Myxozyma melibiosi]|uniref:Aspartic peptidase domain-containing protein n=1 Tax=Myxozyma melibiosi TaxID=54550 RepID=A0ABR1F732_9ASCO